MSEFDRLKEQKDAIVERERRRVISDAITESQDAASPAAPRELSAERLDEINAWLNAMKSVPAKLPVLATPMSNALQVCYDLRQHITALQSRLEAAEKGKAMIVTQEFLAFVRSHWMGEFRLIPEGSSAECNGCGKQTRERYIAFAFNFCPACVGRRDPVPQCKCGKPSPHGDVCFSCLEGHDPERFRKSSALVESEITELFEYIDYLKADAKMVLEQGIQQVQRAITAESRLEAAEQDSLADYERKCGQLEIAEQRAITAEADNAKYKQFWSDIVESLQLEGATNLTIIDEIDTLKADNAKLRAEVLSLHRVIEANCPAPAAPEPKV